MNAPIHYRGYEITYWAKPIRTRAHDYDFAHEDWDLDDPRIGSEASVQACKERIDEIEDDGGGCVVSPACRKFKFGKCSEHAPQKGSIDCSECAKKLRRTNELINKGLKR